MRVTFGVAIAICALAVAACGGSAGDTATPTSLPSHTTDLSFLDILGASRSATAAPTPAPTRSGRAFVTIGTPTTAATPSDPLSSLGTVLLLRMAAAGLTNVQIQQPDEVSMFIDFTGARSDTFVKQVIEAPNLNFREPIRSATGEVMCKTGDGVEFTVQATSVSEGADDAGSKSAHCTARDGTFGTLEWQPAQVNVNGDDKTLIQSMIDAGGVEIRSTPQQGTILLVPLTPEGNAVFSALTGNLVHYPIGIFLGDALLTAPTVQGQITNSEAEITGVSEDELAAARAVIKGGELPVRLTVTSIVPN